TTSFADVLRWTEALGALPVRGKGQARPNRFSRARQAASSPDAADHRPLSPLAAGEEVAMPTRPLPNNPSLEHLRKEAKRSRAAVMAGAGEALAAVREFHPRADRALARFTLADAQLVTARSYGFATWARLKRHLADIEPFVWSPPGAPDPRSRIDVF